MAVESNIDESVAGTLEAGLVGDVLRPGEDACDEARRIWNAMIDRRPAAGDEPSRSAPGPAATDRVAATAPAGEAPRDSRRRRAPRQFVKL